MLNGKFDNLVGFNNLVKFVQHDNLKCGFIICTFSYCKLCK